MARRSKRFVLDSESDILSEEVEDVTIEEVASNNPSKKRRSEEEPWVTKYEPQSVRDVSINPRKVKEVKDIFDPMVNGDSPCRLLVFSGPAGCSKSTLAKCLANEAFRFKDSSSNGFIEYLDSSLNNIYQSEHFRDFMDECRYLVGRNKCVVLIEDLPNVFHEPTLNSFRTCLRNWIFSSPQIDLPPIIICLTEVEIIGNHGQRGFYNIENCLTVETVLGQDLLNSGLSAGLIRRVKFLPIAKSYIKKPLQKIIASESPATQKISVEALTSLYESGDIRSSVSSLEFKSKSILNTDLNDSVRESQITLFHALGKVIHSSSRSRDLPPTSEFSSDYESIKSAVESYHNHGLLHLAVLENYHIYNGSQFGVDIAASIADSLSLNDTFTAADSANDSAIRTTRHELSKTQLKTSRTLPMKFPRHFKMLREENKVRSELMRYVRYIGELSVSLSDANLIDGFFVPLIKNSRIYQRQFGQKRFLYNRIGGTFKGIYADDDMPVMENEEEMGSSERDQFSEDIMEAIRKNQNALDEYNSDEISDGIEDSTTDADDDDDDFGDTLDEDFLRSTNQMFQKQTVASADEFSDDSDIVYLISQGKI